MELKIERSEGFAFAVVAGRVDGDSAGGLRDGVLGSVSGEDVALVVDMGGVSYVSSAGLQTFLVLAKSLRKENVKFGLCSVTRDVNEIFDIGGFRRALAIFDDRESAVAGLVG